MHPLDPLTRIEIEQATAATKAFVKLEQGLKPQSLQFNTVTLIEPPKQQVLAWLGYEDNAPLITRQAEVSSFLATCSTLTALGYPSRWTDTDSLGERRGLAIKYFGGEVRKRSPRHKVEMS